MSAIYFQWTVSLEVSFIFLWSEAGQEFIVFLNPGITFANSLDPYQGQ